MKNLVIVLSSVLAGLFISTAHAENNAAGTLSAQAAAPQRGTLYRIRHVNHTTYLFGTIHVGQPSFFPLEPRVTQALTQSALLVLEVDIRDQTRFQQALQKHGLYASGHTIDQYLSSHSLTQLQQALHRYDVSFDSIKHMKPWAVANMLLSLDLARNGYHAGQGIERFLLSYSEGSARTVQALESAEYQMGLFDSMSDAMQEQYLLEHLSGLDDGHVSKTARALIEAWAAANSEAIEASMRESLQQKNVSSDFTQRILLDRRNTEMTDKIEVLLKEGADAFIGIGMLHLIGKNGVPALLQQRGYAVEKMY